MQIVSLTPAEENLMLLLWKLNVFYLKDVMEQHPEPKPHQNTVSTYLKILVDKGYVSTEKQGRIFKYSILITQREYFKNVQRSQINKFFNALQKDFLEFLFAEKIVDENVARDILKVELPPKSVADNDFPIANEILNPKKDKKKKDKKKKHK